MNFAGDLAEILGSSFPSSWGIKLSDPVALPVLTDASQFSLSSAFPITIAMTIKWGPYDIKLTFKPLQQYLSPL
jgi:hypothetical protein